MRHTVCIALVIALFIPAAALAQEVTVGGWVDRVDTATSTVTLRTLSGKRTIEVAPNAVISGNGAATRLNQIPIGSRIWITAQSGPQGVLRATRIRVQGAGRSTAAAYPAGSVVTGRLVGINIPENQVTLRTSAGDFSLPLGSAPIVRNGRVVTTRDLRVGQQIQVVRSLPTTASTDYITQSVHIMPTSRVAAWPGAPAVRMQSSAGAAARSAARSGYPTVAVNFNGSGMRTLGIIRNGRAMLPVRALVEQLGGTVRWDAGTRTAWAAFPDQGQTLRLTHRSRSAHIYDYVPAEADRAGSRRRVMQLDQSPILVSGRLFAPVSATAEVAGVTATYQPETRQVFIDTASTGRTARR